MTAELQNYLIYYWKTFYVQIPNTSHLFALLIYSYFFPLLLKKIDIYLIL